MKNLVELKKFCEKIGCACMENEPMSAHTSFRIGGPADLFVRPSGEEQAGEVVRAARRLGVGLCYIGKGSDLLVRDEGVRGAVLSLDEASAKPRLRETDGTVIECLAGASLTALCVFAQRHGLSGLEFAYGIPGSVGGAIYMNAGAYGGEMRDVLLLARYLDGEGVPNARAGLELSYRHSWFTDHPDCLITGGTFQLQKGDPEVIRARMDDLMERRKSKQPLEYPSAGSTFKRPKGAYASALIDQCGLKGRRVGGASVSEKHAGFVINDQNATCADVLALVEEVRREVRERTGYTLECEIKLL